MIVGLGKEIRQLRVEGLVDVFGNYCSNVGRHGKV